jgi:hypothetical protein
MDKNKLRGLIASLAILSAWCAVGCNGSDSSSDATTLHPKKADAINSFKGKGMGGFAAKSAPKSAQN